MLTTNLRQRLERLLGRQLKDVRRVESGYTSASRLLVSLSGGGSVFVKIGTDAATTEALRQEQHVYGSLSGPFLPDYLGWNDDGQQPVLVLEDLSEGFWPPPWNESRIQGVLEALEQVWQSKVEELPRLETFTALAHGWETVANDPAPFLSLGIVSENWLQTALPSLLAIDGKAVLRGESLLHLDVRSDNICFLNDRTLLVDWNWACVGNPAFDLGAWLPTLEVEGGPPPETFLPDGREIAALLSGYWASQAGLPPFPGASDVRGLQRRVLAESALPWAVRVLKLPPLDGKTGYL